MFFYLLSFVLGAGLGSFVNVLAARTVAGKSIILPRSFCDACARPLWRRDLIPIVSFFLLRARCRFCRAPIASQYPVVEGVTALLFLLAAHQVGGFSWELIHLWAASAVLVALFLTDLRAMVLPDKITLPALVFFILVGLLLKYPTSNLQLLTSTIVGFGFFALQYFISRGRWVGAGDMRLGALVGAMLGSWQRLVMALTVSYIIGALVSLWLLASHKKGLKSEVPLGTFIAVGTLITLFFGSTLQFFLLK